MGRFFDHLRQVGVRGFIAENANDPDYVRPAEYRGLPTTEDYERQYRIEEAAPRASSGPKAAAKKKAPRRLR
jgi:nitrogen regulatory protein PII-like uncharacterized protein